MSMVGTPTDNPIIESINGWIKEELKYDFDLKIVKFFPEFIKNYVYYFNNERHSCKLNSPLFNLKSNKDLSNLSFLCLFSIDNFT